MESQIIDYYNELPYGINVIDEMNKELIELQKENEELKRNQKTEEEKKMLNKFKMPQIKVESVEEYKAFKEDVDNYCNFIDLATANLPQFFRLPVKPHMNYFDARVPMPEMWVNSMPIWVVKVFCPILKSLIDQLDKLTNYINRDWCECRIFTAIEMYNKTINKGHSGEEIPLSSIIFGLNNNISASQQIARGLRRQVLAHSASYQLPYIYCELSNLQTDIVCDSPPHHPRSSAAARRQAAASADCAGHNILNICYYNCEICGKEDNYCSPELYGNKLLCIYCQNRQDR